MELFLWQQLNKVIELKDNVRAKGDENFINMLSRIRSGNAWDRISHMTEEQIGLGENYNISDYKALLARQLQVITKKKPEVVENFKDALIVVGEKVFRDALNNKIVQNFAEKTKQEVHWYHADDEYHKQPLSNLPQKRMLRVKSNITDDTFGMLPMVPGMRVMITDNITMRGKVANGCIGTL